MYEIQEHYCSLPRTQRLEKGRNTCLRNLNLLSIVCMVGNCRQAHVVYFVRYITDAWQKVLKESSPSKTVNGCHSCLLRFPGWNLFEQVCSQASQPQFLCSRWKEIGCLWSDLSQLQGNAHARWERHTREVLAAGCCEHHLRGSNLFLSGSLL